MQCKDISSLYLIWFWWLWLTAYENPKFKITLWKGFYSCKYSSNYIYIVFLKLL